MHHKVLIFLLLLLLLPFTESSAQQSFDEVLEQALEDKKGQLELYQGKFKRKDEAFERMWQERKAEIEKKWDKALQSTKKEWVDYSQDLNARSYVNFNKGFVEVTAVVPVADKSILQSGERLVNERMLKLFSKDNPSNIEILADQVEMAPNQPLHQTHRNTSSSRRRKILWL